MEIRNMEVMLKLVFDSGGYKKTIELGKEDAKELYDFLHEMFGEKTKTEYIPYEYPRYPWNEYWNQPFYTSGYVQTDMFKGDPIFVTTTSETTDGAEWLSKSGGVVASFMEKL